MEAHRSSIDSTGAGREALEGDGHDVCHLKCSFKQSLLHQYYSIDNFEKDAISNTFSSIRRSVLKCFEESGKEVKSAWPYMLQRPIVASIVSNWVSIYHCQVALLYSKKDDYARSGSAIIGRGILSLASTRWLQCTQMYISYSSRPSRCTFISRK